MADEPLPLRSFVLPHEQWHAAADVPPAMHLLEVRPRGALVWEASVEQAAHGPLVLQIEDRFWPAVLRDRGLLHALAGTAEDRQDDDAVEALRDLADSLRGLGFVDITEREEGPDSIRPLAWTPSELRGLATALDEVANRRPHRSSAGEDPPAAS